MKILYPLIIAFACLQIPIYSGQALADSLAFVSGHSVSQPNAVILANVDSNFERAGGDAMGAYDSDAAIEGALESGGKLERASDAGEATVDGALDEDTSEVAAGGAVRGEPQQTSNNVPTAVTQTQTEAQIETRENVEAAQASAEEAAEAASESVDRAVDASQAQAEEVSESIGDATGRAKQKAAEDISRVEAAGDEVGSRLDAAAEDFAEGFRDLFGKPDDFQE